MTLPVAPPIKPMLAKVQTEMPRGEEWIYEPKWDGFRTLVFKDGKHVDLRSRRDRPMNRYFPEMERLLIDTLPDVCVIDGEIIMPSPSGLDFDALQLRLHPAESRVNKLAEETPTSFVVFDVLGHGKEDLRSLPLSDRIDRLTSLFGTTRPAVARDPATTPGSTFSLPPCTDDPDVAAEWFDDLEKVHLDGIIAKRLSLPYCEDERVMIKIKHRRTADCVVGGYRAHKQGGIGALLLGLYDNGVLHYVGHTSSFSAAERRELFDMLQPMRSPQGSFSFGGEDVGDWGPGGQSRWSVGKEQEWFSVEPKLVCEVSYDYMQSGVRFRHAARFHRWRDDKAPEECTFEQVR
jgi:ATP-dependent DNA ligase